MAGRKPKLTPEVQQRIVDAITAGNYIYVAAQYAGIGQSTFFRWLEEGQQAQSGVKREFWEAVKNAEAQAEARNVAIIERAASDSWQAAAWWLERKHYDRWGRKERVDNVHTGAGGGPIQHHHAGSLTAEILAEAAHILQTLGTNGHANGSREPEPNS